MPDPTDRYAGLITEAMDEIEGIGGHPAAAEDRTAEPTRDEAEPCGENMCLCYCGGAHVCGCDCWRCDDCGQTEEHSDCGDDDA